MDEHPSCPVCTARAWSVLGTRSFDRTVPGADDYLALRLKVLFEVWSPGTDQFIARFVLCEGCGFVAYTPRATADEVDAKYRVIAAEERPKPSRTHDTALDRRRSREIARVLAPYLPGGGALLDFGGGNGALLVEFSRRGFDCGVVDYTPVVVSGVERLGNTLDDLPADATFDVALCSHVFEHLADPVRIARQLHGRLRDGGLLFVEVPLEILGGLPTPREPVTHVNYFCETSLETTLTRAGFGVERCWTEPCTFANGLYRYGVRAVARRVGGAPQTAPAGPDVARALLGAGSMARARRALAQPKILLNPLRAARKRLLGADA